MIARIVRTEFGIEIEVNTDIRRGSRRLNSIHGNDSFNVQLHMRAISAWTLSCARAEKPKSPTAIAEAKPIV